MASLNDLTSSSDVKTTALPGWFDSAQNQAAQAATGALSQVPLAQNTVGQQAVDTLSGGNNPFNQANQTLNDVSYSALNPFTTDAAGNQVANQNSALGGLFASQNNQLNNLIPSIDAASTAGAIGSGGFGSLRSQVAANQARGKAFNDLAATQNQSALSALQNAVQAGQAQGNVGNEAITNDLAAAQWQQASPFVGASALGKVLGGIGNTGSTVTDKTNNSALANAGDIYKVLSSPGMASLGKSIGLDTSSPGALLSGIGKGVTGALGFGKNPAGGVSGPLGKTYQLDGGGSLQMNSDGSQTIINADGTRQYYDAQGNPTTVADDLAAQNIIPAGDYSNLGGGDTSAIDNTDWSQYTSSEE